MLFSQPFFWRTLPDGRRAVSWRVWLLIWLVPGLFLAAALGLLTWEAYRHLATTPTQGEVVRVYAREGETPFDRGVTNYAPVFRYTWSDGQPTEASPGLSHPDWNFEIGSRHEIRYFAGAKTDVVLPGLPNWWPGLIVGGIALAVAPVSVWLHLRMRRWQRAGA